MLIPWALLKLPTGALTAFLGLLLLRGDFVPGLLELATSAQILAWAIVFGYSQQLFTRLIDRQAIAVLDPTSATPDSAERGSSSEADVKQIELRLASAVDRSVQEALAPPRLTDVMGRLEAAWARDDTGIWQLRIKVGTGPRPSSDTEEDESRPFRLVGGEKNPETVLEISVDIPGRHVDVGERAVRIATDGGVHTWIGRVDPPGPAPTQAWVTLHTYGRFLQAMLASTEHEL